MAGPASWSRGTSRSRFAAPPGADLRILLPEDRSYALTLRTDPVDHFRPARHDRACVTERDPPRRSRARVESGTHRPVSDHGSARTCSLPAFNVWSCALTPRSNCGTCASPPYERAHRHGGIVVSEVRGGLGRQFHGADRPAASPHAATKFTWSRRGIRDGTGRKSIAAYTFISSTTRRCRR